MPNRGQRSQPKPIPLIERPRHTKVVHKPLDLLQIPTYNVAPSHTLPQQPSSLLGEYLPPQPSSLLGEYTPMPSAISTVVSERAEDFMFKKLLDLVSTPLGKSAPTGHRQMTQSVYDRTPPAVNVWPPVHTHSTYERQKLPPQNTSSFLQNVEMPVTHLAENAPDEPAGSNSLFGSKTDVDLLAFNKLKALISAHAERTTQSQVLEKEQKPLKSLLDLNPMMVTPFTKSDVSPLNKNLGVAKEEAPKANEVTSEAKDEVSDEQARQDKMDQLLMMLSLLKESQKSGMLQMDSNQNLLNEEHNPLDENVLGPNINKGMSLQSYSEECDPSMPANIQTGFEDPQTDQTSYTGIGLPPSSARSGKELPQDEARLRNRSTERTSGHTQSSRPLGDPKLERRESGSRQKNGKVDKNVVSSRSIERHEELRKTNRPLEGASDLGIQSSRPIDDPKGGYMEGDKCHEKRGRQDRNVSAPFVDEELRRTQRPQKGTHDPEWELKEGGKHHEKRGRQDRDFVSAPYKESQEEFRRTHRPQEETSDPGIWRSGPFDNPEWGHNEGGKRHEKHGRMERDFALEPFPERQEELRRTHRPQEGTSDRGRWSSRPFDNPEQVGMPHEKHGRQDRDFIHETSGKRPQKSYHPQERTSDPGIWSSKSFDDPEWKQKDVGMLYEKHSRLDRDISAHAVERREELRNINRSHERPSDHGIRSSRHVDDPEWDYGDSGVRHEKRDRLDRDLALSASTEREKFRTANRSQEKNSDRGIGNSRWSDDPEWAERERNMQNERHGRLDTDFFSRSSIERWEDRERERNFDNDKWNSRPSDHLELGERESDMRYQRSGRLDRDFVSPRSAEGWEERKAIKPLIERASDRGMRSSRPYEDPESHRESFPHYEKRYRLDSGFDSPRSAGRREEHKTSNRSQERATDEGIRSSRGFDDWPQRESGVYHEKHARLDRDFVSPRSTEGREELRKIIPLMEKSSYDLQSSRPYEEPEWEQRERGSRYEKPNRLDRGFVSSQSTGRREDYKEIPRSHEKISDYGLRNSRAFDDPEWPQRDSGAPYTKYARLDRDIVSPRSKERWGNNNSDSLSNLPERVVKRMKGKDPFTVSAILSEFAQS